jgi:hypothetical protein
MGGLELELEWAGCGPGSPTRSLGHLASHKSLGSVAGDPDRHPGWPLPGAGRGHRPPRRWLLPDPYRRWLLAGGRG